MLDRMGQPWYTIYVRDIQNERGEFMENKKKNVSFYKAGNGEAARINLSIPALRKIGITKETKEVIVIYEDDRVIIKKA